MMSVKASIENKIRKEFSPIYLEVVDESHRHKMGSETHFKLLVVSEKFEKQSRVDRQRWVNQILSGELSGPIHALSQRLLTPSEWKPVQWTSPGCVRS